MPAWNTVQSHHYYQSHDTVEIHKDHHLMNICPAVIKHYGSHHDLASMSWIC
jgi:hypothetical protein